ncbi:MAG: signal peptide peptidase SppA [Bacteroides sp.]|nr:signal peptide peptidase SppA [Bacteroides sp.]
MKDFLKMTLASLTGIVLATIVLTFLGAIILVGMVSSSDSETVVRKNSVMVLDLNGKLVERRPETSVFEALLNVGSTPTYGLDEILSSIRKAKEHDDIKGIYIQAESLSAPYASLQEIRQALTDFKESGKFIVAYADYYTQRLYYLSSVADKVILNPKGSVEWQGMAAQPTFYKNLLDKLGVDIQVFRVGGYKSAVEPFIATEMSPENRQQISEYIGSIWNTMLTDISASRDLPVDSLYALADRMLMLKDAELTLQAGLVDTLMYEMDVRDYLRTTWLKLDKDKKFPALDLEAMNNVRRNVPKDKSGNVIAVYYAVGDIVTSDTGTGEAIASEKVIRDLRKLQQDDNVKAVVMRVNSPGGSAYASEQIWHAVKELKSEKPVIVSMGDYAASGGYYIACIADTIVAQANTLTGSIGIFGMIPNLKGLTDKIGLNFDVVKTNKYSDFGNLTRAFNAEEAGIMQEYLNQGYDLFLRRCAEGRGVSTEEIHTVAQGRVWTGDKALELGLVDVLGGLDTALEIAIEKAGVEKYTVIPYPEKENLLSSLLSSSSSRSIESRLLKENLGGYYSDFMLLKNLQEADQIQTRLPFELHLK